tara:strand:+ start:127 stop:534 length:408 start_codon:yes stop_codon:yes gene_type:complete
MTTKEIYTQPIASFHQAAKLFLDLLSEGKDYHPEDDALDIGIFTEEEAKALNERMAEMYRLPWNQEEDCIDDENSYECPCDMLMSLDAKSTGGDYHVCTHPDHVDGVSCADRAVGCNPHCLCCMEELATPTERLA